MDKLDVIAKFRTEGGVISANEIFERFAKLVVSNEREDVTRILSWRDSRTDFGLQYGAEIAALPDDVATGE